MQIVDAWMQHPTRRFLAQPFFDSLRRWTGRGAAADVPLAVTLGSMDEAAVGVGLTASACLEGLPALGLAPDAQQQFLSGNARRVFELDGAG